MYVYSSERIVLNLMNNDGMTEEEAWDYFSFNIELVNSSLPAGVSFIT